MNILEGWTKKEGAKRETYVRVVDGKSFYYEVSGSARQFFQMKAADRVPLDILPDWIITQLNRERLGNDNDEIQKVEKNENKEDKEIEKLPKSLINSIPDILSDKRIITPADLEEWKNLSVFDRILLFQKTPKNLVSKRRGFLLPTSAGKDKKTLTDADFKMFNYVEGNVMKQEGNIAFLFEWTAQVEETKWFDKEVVVRGYIEVEINGKLYRRPGAGSGIKKNDMMDWGDVLETAQTEMIKRGFKSLGFNGDVYRNEVD